jgi:NAD(P)-dependent dehydrogenase (short-subunit alcohol dehydrogenase family)
VFIGDIDEEGAGAQSEKLGGEERAVLFGRMDVASDEDWKRTVDSCLSKWGRLDIVVNNAGTTYKNKVRIMIHYAQHALLNDLAYP